MDSLGRRIINVFKPGTIGGKTEPTEEQRSVSVAKTDSFALPYGGTVPIASIPLSLQLSTVYRCTQVISDSIASQMWQIKEYSKSQGFVNNPFHKLAWMLNYEPNPDMSRYTFMKVLVEKTLLNGACYIIVRRDDLGDAIRLDLVNGSVKLFRRDNGYPYYEVSYGPNDLPPSTKGEKTLEIVESSDMIVILNFSYDGIHGISTLQHAANVIDISQTTEDTAKGFFASGANMSGLLSFEDPNVRLTKDKADAMKKSFADALSSNKGGTPGGIVVMEGGGKFTPITVNPKDAQLLEAREFNAIQICRFFGVNPIKIFESDSVNYNSIEGYQLAFLTDAISPLDSKIENEFNRKLFRPSLRGRTILNLDVSELLRANLDAKANYVSKMFQCGGYNVNEVRATCGNPISKEEGANKPLVQVNMIPVDKLGQKEQKTKPVAQTE
jgi:HK97 family phage portal protein